MSRGSKIAAIEVAVVGIVTAGVPKSGGVATCKGGSCVELINLYLDDPMNDSTMPCACECSGS